MRWSMAYNTCRKRKAFNRSLNTFQELRHRVAQLSAELACLKAFNYQICNALQQNENVTKNVPWATSLYRIYGQTKLPILQF